MMTPLTSPETGMDKGGSAMVHCSSVFNPCQVSEIKLTEKTINLQIEDIVVLVNIDFLLYLPLSLCFCLGSTTKLLLINVLGLVCYIKLFAR